MESYLRLLKLVWPYRIRLAVGLITGILFASVNGAQLLIVQKVLAKVFEENQTLSFWQIAQYTLLVPAIFVVRGLLAYTNGYLMNWVGIRVVMDLRNLLFAHLQDLSLDFYNATPVGELMSRVSNDCEVVRKSVSTTLSDLCKEPFTVVGVLGSLFYMDPVFTLVSLISFPACVVPIAIFSRKVRKASKSAQQNLAQLTSILHENFTAVRIVKAFGMERYEINKFHTNTNKLIRIAMKVVRANETLTPLIESLGALGVSAVFLYAYERHMKSSEFVALAMGMFLLYQPIKKLSKVQLTLEQSTAAADRVFEIVDTVPSILNAPNAEVLPVVRDQIVFEDVDFNYGDKPILQKINVTVKAGSVLAIVGATGSGKTTMLNLIPRFYDPTSGRITIDGHDLRTVTMESLRQQIGIVTQETILFDDTVANNIAYGSPTATRDQIIEAARKAHADLFVQQMPQGYDTVVGEKGTRISGGERQRLAIARALLKNPPLLILDEATSALDSKTEKLVQEAIDELMRNRTVFAIAHRLSTIQHADCILVLDHGRIVERGTHAELLANGGVYKRLHDQQFQL